MGLRIIRTPASRVDLVEIWSHIAGDNEAAADRVLDRFKQRLDIASNNPQVGRARPELGVGIRSLVSGAYLLFYRIDRDKLLLVRVRHGALDIGPEDFTAD